MNRIDAIQLVIKSAINATQDTIKLYSQQGRYLSNYDDLSDIFANSFDSPLCQKISVLTASEIYDIWFAAACVEMDRSAQQPTLGGEYLVGIK